MGLSFAAVEVGDSLQRGLDNLIGFLPRLIGFLIIVAIGYIIARIVKGIVTKVLENIGTDRAIHSRFHGRVRESCRTRLQAELGDRHDRVLVPVPRRPRGRRLAARDHGARQLRRRDRRRTCRTCWRPF